ncbi:MAG: murein hydrolase activator EnvC family protein [Luteibaculaceae bacterium]
MSPLNKILLLLVFSFSWLNPSVLFAQNKVDLQKQRDNLNQQIKFTNQLIDKAKNEQRLTQTQLVILNKQIEFRAEILNSYKTELRLLDKEIREKENEIKSLEGQLQKLKESYAKLIRHAYTNRNNYDKLMFIFAARDFMQAYKRLKYLQQIAQFRKQQAEAIEVAKEELIQKIDALELRKQEKTALLQEEQKEIANLNGDKQEQQKMLGDLQKQEKTLRAQLKKQEQESQKLNAEIQRIIKAEIEAAKAKNKGEFRLSPEEALISGKFEANRGKLPWPVERGIISGTFGVKPHPVLKGIQIENNGVDFATEKDAAVRAIFEGTVTMVYTLSGAGKAVMISHGGYISVYANLKEVFVKKGDKVETKQFIGKVLTNESTGKTEAHLEIWKISGSGSDKQNPQLWIAK